MKGAFMPWALDSDLEKYKKGMTDAQKEKWIAIANNVLKLCDKSPDECEASAIKIANSKISESTIMGDVVTLTEKAVGEDGIFPIRIIKPGWGSSGYYPTETLKRDGGKVFTKGLKMYWDHPTQSEESERPERSLRDLAGELISDAEWKDSGLYGAGLYASAKVFEPYRAAVKELTPHIGVSIRAAGIAEQGEADGREGLIVEEITNAASVDFVTVPGAGGKVLELFESYRDPEQIKKGLEMEEIKELKEAKVALEAQVSEKDKLLKEANEKVATADKALKEANDSLLKANEAVLLKQAAEFVEKKLPAELPDMTKKRLIEKLSKSPVLTEDKKLDEVKFGELIEAAVKEEKEYLSGVIGSGKITGMGESESEEDKVNLEESFKEHFLSQGFSEEKATQMAKFAGVK
jgi:hypothetical protein